MNIACEAVRFYTKDGCQRTLYHNGENGNTLIITTQDDYAIVEILDWNNYEERDDLIWMSFPDPKTPNNPHGYATFGGGWRELSSEGVDRSIIREIISAINYAVSEEARALGDSYTGKITAELCNLIASITEQCRPVWANNPDEPIPTPIPSRNREINN